MRRKELIERLLRTGRRLAQGLLRRRRRIVTDTFLYSLVISGAGCIVPTALDLQPSSPNYAPVILTERLTDPKFGPLGPLKQAEAIAITIAVDDPDDNQPTSQDDLHARLFFYFPNTKTFVSASSSDVTLTVSHSDVNDPYLALGHFPNETLCVGRSGTFYLYVVVGDRTFAPTAADPTAVENGGASDRKYWVLTCA
jgi:hypothetical protein